jgi:hypothetical protein
MMMLTKDVAKRCATVAKFEGIAPKKALEALTDYAYQAWLDSRVCRAVPKPVAEPAV